MNAREYFGLQDLTNLVLNQHGNINKHVVEFFNAALQPHDVFVTSLDLIQGLLVDLRVHDLWGRECEVTRDTQLKRIHHKQVDVHKQRVC